MTDESGSSNVVVTLYTRKPVTSLTPADLEAFPVWEYAMDEEGAVDQDETWVKPVDSQFIPLDRPAMQVATEFRAAHDQRFSGFSMVASLRGQV